MWFFLYCLVAHFFFESIDGPPQGCTDPQIVFFKCMSSAKNTRSKYHPSNPTIRKPRVKDIFELQSRSATHWNETAPMARSFHKVWQSLILHMPRNLYRVPKNLMQKAGIAISQFHDNFTIRFPFDLTFFIAELSAKSKALRPPRTPAIYINLSVFLHSDHFNPAHSLIHSICQFVRGWVAWVSELYSQQIVAVWILRILHTEFPSLPAKRWQFFCIGSAFAWSRNLQCLQTWKSES